jgi:hypothetical protein
MSRVEIRVERKVEGKVKGRVERRVERVVERRVEMKDERKAETRVERDEDLHIEVRITFPRVSVLRIVEDVGGMRGSQRLEPMEGLGPDLRGTGVLSCREGLWD